MPQEVIDQVHRLARRDKSKRSLTFTNRNNQDLNVLYADIDDDEHENDAEHAHNAVPAGVDDNDDDNNEDSSGNSDYNPAQDDNSSEDDNNNSNSNSDINSDSDSDEDDDNNGDPPAPETAEATAEIPGVDASKADKPQECMEKQLKP